MIEEMIGWGRGSRPLNYEPTVIDDDGEQKTKTPPKDSNEKKIKNAYT